VVSGTTQITAVGISLERKTRLFAWAAWTTALANMVLNFAMIPIWGATGAALATFLSYTLLTGLYLMWSQRLHPIPLEKARLLSLGAVIIAMVAASPLIGAAEPSFYVVLLKVAVLGLMLVGAFALGIVDAPTIRGFLREARKT
jgi:O-antigen/teichoic acid export membrane protein